ncbi:hypothetical protein Poli38472_002378 [Pythium oligandrum]|uniref:Glutathione S-transferase n=1 Tax=Pythium oligandrum TaxID=41045 RepID=A0A8K1FL34_PYTOL|nr:hypothetical protein Poli38472_002378 [Pythium oligandrum]|eukprot:TMW63437.1 hypothetical protein Poli38472_002378 [Pythium oligandrum]
MVQPRFKLSYFDLPIRAELARLAFTFGGIEFEDDRFTISEWKERKYSYPLHHVPVLEVDNKVYVQSMAIARYAGRLAGIYPTDPMAALNVDMMLDTLLEVMEKYIDVRYRITDIDMQEEKAKEAMTEFLPTIFSFVEKSIQGKFLFGDSITIADLFLFDTVATTMPLAFPDYSLASYPKIQAIVEAVKTSPRIGAYLAAQK